ncbi:MAG: ABC transporter permease [Candidatus Dormibacteria bacterium]
MIAKWEAVAQRKETIRRRAMLAGRLGLVPIVALLCWQVFPQTFLPTPVDVLHTAWSMVRSGVLLPAIGLSAFRVGVGFVCGAGAGTALGLLVAFSPVFEGVVGPLIRLLRPIPPLALVPLAILWLGTGSPAAIAILVFACVFPSFINTADGLRQVDSRLLQAATTMGLPVSRVALRVALPASYARIVLGWRLSMQVAWTSIVGAELVLGATSSGVVSSTGIGQLLFNLFSYESGRRGIAGVLVVMAVIGLVSLGIDRAFRSLPGVAKESR